MRVGLCFYYCYRLSNQRGNWRYMPQVFVTWAYYISLL